MSSSETAARLLATHRTALERYLIRFTGDRDLAEDLVQETYVRLVERPPADGRNARAWLFTVATNLARDAARAERRHSALWHAEPAAPAECADPAALVERGEARMQLRAALLALTPRERTALLMREEGFRHREIAEAVDTTVQSVGTILARALIKLRRELGVATPADEEDG